MQLTAFDDTEVGTKLSDYAVLLLGLECQSLTEGPGAFYRYVQKAWNLVEPTQPFTPNWHIEELCRTLEDCYYEKVKRLIVNVPPGTAKSLIVNVFFPTWVWAKNARKRFLTASYSQSLTMRDNLRARQIIESPWFQDRWPVHMMEDQNAKGRYNTTEHGWRIATSVNGQGIGEHPDFIIIDDPTNAQQAESEVERSNANSWFDNTISTRLGRNPCIIVIMQRLHMNDLSGHLLARGGWTHLRWPMRYEVCTCETTPVCHPNEADRCAVHKADPTWSPDAKDHRTTQGELLFPALFPEEKVRGLELNLGAYGAAGQLQQRPSPEGGGQFKREWFAEKFVDVRPKQMRAVRSWDTAGSEGKGDWTVGAFIGEEFDYVPQVVNGKEYKKLMSTCRFFICDVTKGQLSPDGVEKLMIATAEMDGKAVGIYEEQEPGSSGKTVVLAREKMFKGKGYRYSFATAGGSKTVKAKNLRKEAEGGNVYLLRGAWNADFLNELCMFPTGNHDDQVDAAANGINKVILEEPPRKVELTW